jgi:isopenicillin N synthase-like dioxygenase
MRTIPQVDLADFTSGDAQRRANFVQKLGKAYEEVGFVTVSNHGLTEAEIADLYKQIEKLF